ncbi:MAG: DUF47 domain-containing protein [Thermoplasmata archaeon]
MGVRKSIKNIFVSGEKNLFLEIGKYATLGMNATNVLKTMVSCESSVNLNAAKETLKKIETDGDSMTFEMKNSITSGAVNPALIDSFLELVDRTDDILDTLYYIGREIARYREYIALSSAGERETVCGYYNRLNQALDYNLESLSSLGKIVKDENLSSVIKSWSAIEKMESEVDDIKDELLDRLYLDSKRISYLSFIHLSSVIHKIDDLLDQSEDIADIILQIITAVTS